MACGQTLCGRLTGPLHNRVHLSTMSLHAVAISLRRTVAHRSQLRRLINGITLISYISRRALAVRTASGSTLSKHNRAAVCLPTALSRYKSKVGTWRYIVWISPLDPAQDRRR